MVTTRQFRRPQPKCTSLLSIRRLLCLLAATLLPACADYTWKFNEQVVHEPPSLFRDFAVDDPALQICLQQAIEDQQVQKVEQLNSLGCSDAGISTVTGIEQFSGLRRIDLDGNQIKDTGPLALLPKLQILHLRNNRLSSLEPLICAPRLSEIALTGNTALACEDLKYLSNCRILATDSPVHCAD